MTYFRLLMLVLLRLIDKCYFTAVFVVFHLQGVFLPII